MCVCVFPGRTAKDSPVGVLGASGPLWLEAPVGDAPGLPALTRWYWLSDGSVWRRQREYVFMFRCLRVCVCAERTVNSLDEERWA